MKLISAIVLMAATTILFAQENSKSDQKWTSGRPDGHAPISVMGDHMHGRGEWMFSYRYMFMDMDGLKRGSKDVPSANALADYMVTPTKMPMNMHMLGAMFAPTNRLTFMGMINYADIEMDHLTRMGTTFTVSSSGFGDLLLAGIYKFIDNNRQVLHGQLGFSIPTGSVTVKDVTPASAPNETVLPYPMQLGSGTLDARLAITYLGQADIISWGSQLKSIIRFGENERDYRYGNTLSLNNWVGWKATDWLSASIRLEGLIVGEIDGADPNLNPMMVVTADTANSGGTYINGGFGINTYIPEGQLKNLRIGIEFAIPFYQDVSGVQLKTKELLTLGTQYSF
jgi:hypothetical protein